jgi:hypothetical protein
MHFPANSSPINFIADTICKASSYKFYPNKYAKTRLLSGRRCAEEISCMKKEEKGYYEYSLSGTSIDYYVNLPSFYNDIAFIENLVPEISLQRKTVKLDVYLHNVGNMKFYIYVCGNLNILSAAAC